MSQEELIASNAELKAQVEYLVKEVAKLTKFKLSMVQTPEESEDENDASSVATIRARNPDKSASDFKVDMPTFEGKNDLDDFLEWLETVERVFDFKNVSEEKKVKLVAFKFRKYASTWWTNVTIRRRRENKSPVTSWNKMRALLKKKFLPENYIRENFSKLQHLRQGSRSVEEYNREFEELLLRCDLQEDYSQTFVRYLFGLNVQIANTVELQDYHTLDDLTKLALKVESQIKKGKAAQMRISSSNPPLLPTPSSPSPSLAPSSHHKPILPTPTSNIQNQPRHNQNINRTLKCYRCQGNGHIAQDCPNKKVMTLVECYDDTFDPSWDKEEEEYVRPDDEELLVIRSVGVVP
ncbi:unnamed protein product [Cuscuta campestris]|uniref:CCHC-type domain-containing protein n=1 Tax=Cuscuta campestris TaxID=132261 RepID=A0A484M3L2_9ASTE|nr:unnamed protein product [Cuscuta campestris]